MDKSYRIGIIGAGAIGGVLAAELTLKGCDIEVVCKYTDMAKLCRAGLKITGVRGERTVPLNAVRETKELSSKKDVILIATKAYDLPAAAKEALPLLNEGGLIVSMQNGVCIDVLEEIAGPEKAVGSVITYSATQISRGHMELTGEGGLAIGFKNGAVTPGLQKLREVLCGAFPTEITGGIMDALYTKLIVNSCISSLGVLTGLTLGEEMKLPEAREIFAGIVKEAVLVADAMGLKLHKFGGRLDYYKFVKGGGPIARLKRGVIMRAVGNNYKDLVSSSYQSYLRGRPTEIDFLNGYIAENARKHNIPAPVNDKVIKQVKEIEAGARKPGIGNLEEFRRV